MIIQQWFDREVIKLATKLGGDTPARDQIVFFCANVLPFTLVIAGVWLFCTGKTKVQRERNQNAVIIAGGAAVIAAGIRALLAHSIARDRPFEAYPYLHHLQGHFTGSGVYSFPSGHAFVMFAFAGTIYFLGQHPKLAWFLLLVSTVVSVARVVAGYHYPTDVLGGALLGLGLAKLVSWQGDWARQEIGAR